MYLIWLRTANTQPDCVYEFSCMNDTLIYTDTGINCRAHGSCVFATIQNTQDSITGTWTMCGGGSSCQQVKSFEGDVTYAGHIYGYLGLAWAKYVNIPDDTLWCGGEASCSDIGSLFINQWWCHGVSSCSFNHNLNTMTNLYGRSMLAAQNSILNSSSDFTSYMTGVFSGFNTTVACQAGKSCSLTCEASGCVGLTLICSDSASSCTINCDEDAGDICPSST